MFNWLAKLSIVNCKSHTLGRTMQPTDSRQLQLTRIFGVCGPSFVDRVERRHATVFALTSNSSRGGGEKMTRVRLAIEAQPEVHSENAFVARRYIVDTTEYSRDRLHSVTETLGNRRRMRSMLLRQDCRPTSEGLACAIYCFNWVLGNI